MMTINIVLGDWSGDGHGKRDSILLEVDGTLDDLKAAFYKGVEMLGWDITKYCDDYGDTKIPLEFVQAIKEVFPEQDLLKQSELDEEGNAYLWKDEFLDIFTETIMLGNPDLVFRYVDLNSDWYIGGYGFFE